VENFMASEAQQFAIQTTGLTKVFRDFWGQKRVVAVDKLNLNVRNREVYGLLGPNGSGKSTTIKMLLGLLFPSRGFAKVLGQPPGHVKTNSRIGYLPEESQLYPFLSARETLDFYGRLFGLTGQERRRRIDSLLDMVGLSSIGRRPIGEFSKGMARRIGLAQALINDPDLLILDEPTSGLDPIGTRQIKDLIVELGRRGKTVLLCSHLLADVEDVCDRIGILYGGKMHTEGQVNELLALREMTQIRAEKLDPDTITQIEQIIRQSHPDYQVEVLTPRDRLEDYFLRTVAQAQAAELETSGAVMGTGLSDFLTAAQEKPSASETVIEQLVTGREPQTATVSDERPGATEPVTTAQVTPGESDQPRREVLESLVDSSTTPVAPTSATGGPKDDLTTPVEPPADEQDAQSSQNGSADAQVDKSVIDDLLRDRKRQDSAPPD
jgi:ABC-2 type transport system ATP-binding protein